MTTLIFRQGGNNTRIGNTFVWAEAAKNWCDKNGFEFVFRSGVDIFQEIFDDVNEFFVPEKFSKSKSPFLSVIDEYANMFGRISVTCGQSKSYVKGRLLEVLPNSLAYANMANEVWNQAIAEEFHNYDYVIIDEPFPFKVDKSLEIERKLIIRDKVSDLIAKNSSFRTVVVHVRQGDYLRWQNGKYYKDNVFYNELLQSLIKLKSESFIERVFVVHNGEFSIESNLEKDIDIIDELDEFSEHIRDILVLACSTLIVGPYSTFSKFACEIAKQVRNQEIDVLFFDSSSQVSDLLIDVKRAVQEKLI